MLSSQNSPPESRDMMARDDDLITSTDPQHPANLICTMCRSFYNLGWVTGTGGGTSIARDFHIFIAPSGVQKELMQPSDIFVMHSKTRSYVRKPPDLKPSACTSLFLAAFDRGAGCCIHTHSQWAVLVTLLVEKDAMRMRVDPRGECFEIEEIEQIKGLPKGRGKGGMMGFYDRLQVPIIDNTAHEEDLTQSLEVAMNKFPDTYAVLVRRHGVYVWGDDANKAKTQAESLDYIFRIAVEMRGHGLSWTNEKPSSKRSLPISNDNDLENVDENAAGGKEWPTNAAMKKAGSKIEPLGKRKRGKPSKGVEEAGVDENEDGKVQKKGRGRPRKSVDLAEVGTSGQITKRPPGRPKINA